MSAGTTSRSPQAGSGTVASRPRRSPFPRSPRALLVTLLVLAVLLGAGVVVTGVAVHGRAAADDAGVAAEAAARTSLERLLSYDATDLAPTRGAIDELTTGVFRDQFTGVFTQVVTPNALAQKARSRAVVRQAGVVSRDADRVVVLLFITQTTSSTRLPGDRIDTIQARATMVASDGRWLVSGLDQI